MRELRGAEAASAICTDAMRQTAELIERGIAPCLGVVRIGDDAADAAYERGIRKRFDAAGAKVESICLSADCTQEEAEEAIAKLSADDSVHGILLFTPLPKHLDADRLRKLIPAEKDADGANPLSAGLLMGGRDCFAPCTAEAVIRLIEHYKIDLGGKNVCIIGRSNVVGKPLGLLLLGKNATVTVCHTATRNLAAHTLNADIIIASAGKPEMITADMVTERSILIDVGINSEKNNIRIRPSACGGNAACGMQKRTLAHGIYGLFIRRAVYHRYGRPHHIGRNVHLRLRIRRIRQQRELHLSRRERIQRGHTVCEQQRGRRRERGNDKRGL